MSGRMTVTFVPLFAVFLLLHIFHKITPMFVPLWKHIELITMFFFLLWQATHKLKLDFVRSTVVLICAILFFSKPFSISEVKAHD